jgi:hypothetical protein
MATTKTVESILSNLKFHLGTRCFTLANRKQAYNNTVDLLMNSLDELGQIVDDHNYGPASDYARFMASELDYLIGQLEEENFFTKIDEIYHSYIVKWAE